MSKLDEVFDDNTAALTRYHDDFGNEIIDHDTIKLTNQYTVKQQIKALFLQLVKSSSSKRDLVEKVEEL